MKSATLFLNGQVGRVALEVFKELDFPVDAVFLEPPHVHESDADFRAIRVLAEATNVKVLTPNPRSAEIWRNQTDSHYIFSFGYRRMISDLMRSSVSGPSIGSHFAPLPRYRGFAPLNWALINGEQLTAVTLFKLVSEVDAGDVLASAEITIQSRDTIITLLERALEAFTTLLRNELPRIDEAITAATPQDHTQATYACARRPEDGRIDWSMSAARIDRLIRALLPPFTGAFCTLDGQRVTILDAEPVVWRRFEGIVPGRVAAITPDGVLVLCGDGECLLIRELSVNGTRRTIHEMVSSPRVTFA